MAKPIHSAVLFVFLTSLSGCGQSAKDNSQCKGTCETTKGTYEITEAVNDTDSTRVIKGQVVTANGQPVDDIEVATKWSANGQQWNDDGTFPKLDTAEAISEYWNEEGTIVSFPMYRASLLGNGTYQIECSKKYSYMVLALNQQQTLGGIAYAPPHSNEYLTIKLEPLVRVYGEIRCDGTVPAWTGACMFPGTLKQKPGCPACVRFMFCGSEKGKFSFLLPPGVYEFHAYSEEPDAQIPESAQTPGVLIGDIRIELSATQGELNLGTIELVKTTDDAK